MEKSEQINDLAAALAKAQGEMKTADKNAKGNPQYKSKYADLAEILKTIQEPLAKNGLSFVQLYNGVDGKGISVTTMLMHISGQYISNTGNYPVGRQDIQGVGSAITYARRYSLTAMLGIAQEDDDGNAACEKKQEQYKQPEREQQEQPVEDRVFVTKDKNGTKVLLREGFKYIFDVEAERLKRLLTSNCYKAAHDDIRLLLGSLENG